MASRRCDPYATGDTPDEITARYFSSGNTLTMSSYDPPAQRLENITEFTNFSDDAFFGDDRFETYVFYFTGRDPGNPSFQRAIGYENSNLPVARLEWRWGGQVVFDPSVGTTKYKLGFSNSTQGPLSATSTNSAVDMSVSRLTLQDVPCPGTSATSNPIDDSRVFVRRQYLDFLGREPDQPGWDFWRSQMTRCIFDTACIDGERVHVAKSFFYADEFIATVPGLNAAFRGTNSYHREFVRQCYYRFLQRTCDPEQCDAGGFNFWVDKLNSQYPVYGDSAYDEMIRAFIVSIEYRVRFGQ